VIYVATAPKSNAAYTAYGAAVRTAKEAGSLLPPKHPQRADETYAAGRLRAGLCLRPCGGRGVFRAELLSDTLERQKFTIRPNGFEREIRNV
jgi:putative ATPase